MGDNKHPVRIISETLLDFAHPFIEMIDVNTTQQDIENGLMIAITPHRKTWHMRWLKKL